LNREKRKTHWDLKYEQGLPSLTKPDPFFVFTFGQFVETSFPQAGLALDVAFGLWRHALWLAKRGWQVCAVDLSEVAIGKLNHAARASNVKLDLFAGDASEYEFVPKRFNLIVLFYHTDRSLLPKLITSLCPGGLLICKLSLRWDNGALLSGNRNDPLNRNELPSLLPGLHVLHNRERPVGDRGVVEFAGRKKIEEL